MKALFTEEAIDDLVDLHGFLTFAESPGRATEILAGIRGACQKLAEFPEQGHVSPELEGYKAKYREIRFKAWRIICRTEEKKLHVFAIVDSRRDVQSFLQHRLLR
ncbi:type II toxin-antitoxin system RelE/ParE family toxin [Pontiella sulfatireligans]|uniref:Plasmid stabilization protein n=1 Tax=Pontiella sulfatireligans TaxID=2750658 RepID=A0A6C2UI04_9BACT|nr:type II toxin-antitoxin system RelE/ParE family toxin [Pontiella sulfatireligans]VGO19041.1 hypothetical protein SCARR_01096 [Pontiella sulfatireligans]